MSYQLRLLARSGGTSTAIHLSGNCRGAYALQQTRPPSIFLYPPPLSVGKPAPPRRTTHLRKKKPPEWVSQRSVQQNCTRESCKSISRSRTQVPCSIQHEKVLSEVSSLRENRSYESCRGRVLTSPFATPRRPENASACQSMLK